MDILEQDFSTEQTSEVSKSAENEKEKVYDLNYSKKIVHSFGEAVDDIVSFSEEEKDRTVAIWDVDGVLIENRLTQYPGICHFFNHNVSEKVKKDMERLISELGEDAITVATNRDEKVSVVWSSNRIVNTIQEALESIHFPTVKIFTGLSKQLPGAVPKKREPLVNHYANYVIDNDIRDNLRICIVEDASILGLNRRVFPEEIAMKIQEKVRERLGRSIGVDIIDYVLK